MFKPPYPLLNLTVDVQDPCLEQDGVSLSSWELDADVGQHFLQTVEDSVRTLRAQGVPTLRIVMGDKYQLYPATESWSSSSLPTVRDTSQLPTLRLTKMAPSVDEDVFMKCFMNGFISLNDIHTRPELAVYLASGKDDNKFGEGSISDVSFGPVTLEDRLRELGVERVTIMGRMAGFCPAQNALAASLKGFDCTVLRDRLVGWKDKSYTKAVWYLDNPQYHEDEMKDAFAEIGRDPTSRGYALSDQAAIVTAVERIKFSNFPDFIFGLNPRTPEPVIQVPGRNL